MRQLKLGSILIASRESKSLKRYLQEIASIPLINADREIELSLRIRKGDAAALHSLVRANLRFVVSVAKKYQHNGLPLEDLINEGNKGLIKAVEKFDHTKGFKFISFAIWWIRQSILIALAEQVRVVKLPIHKNSLVTQLENVSISFLQEEGRDPSTQELADLLQRDEQDVDEALKLRRKHLSLDESIAGDPEKHFPLESVLKSKEDQPDTALDRESFVTDINRALKKKFSKERDREIICSLFGIDGREMLSFETVGMKYGLSPERVRQIKVSGIKKLRKCSFLRQHFSP